MGWRRPPSPTTPKAPSHVGPPHPALSSTAPARTSSVTPAAGAARRPGERPPSDPDAT
ncbi:hypothetical protein [Amycolatopsis plumensis]|uniref:hypothetical protein n=1 Tax=Amycolatopsis plumensis TaxID=236508 RepID=UPI0036102071